MARPRSLSYNAAVGCLHLRVGARERGYWLDVLARGDGRAPYVVRLTKIVPPAGDEGGEYDVTVGPGGGSCACRGFRRWRRCKHGAAVAALIERGLI